MAIYSAYGPASCCGSPLSRNPCPDRFGCVPGVCPHFQIKRHDTKPPFKVEVEDCDGPLPLADLVIEANMWAKGKLRKAITPSDAYFQLVDNVGFEQMMVGDIIIMDRVRRPEHMLIEAFDEENKYVLVRRGYNGTVASSWAKGSPLRIMKFMNAPAESLSVFEDVSNIDGTTTTDVLRTSILVYEWRPEDVCLPGCYYFEFKALKMTEVPEVAVLSAAAPSTIPSFTEGLTPADYGCAAVLGVDWSRRFPVTGEGYVIQITDSVTPD